MFGIKSRPEKWVSQEVSIGEKIIEKQQQSQIAENSDVLSRIMRIHKENMDAVKQ